MTYDITLVLAIGLVFIKKNQDRNKVKLKNDVVRLKSVNRIVRAMS